MSEATGRRGRIEEPDWILMPLGFRDYVEVKYRNQIRKKDAKPLVDQDGGLLLTKQTYEWDPDRNVLALPVHYFLAGLPWRLTLYPSSR